MITKNIINRILFVGVVSCPISNLRRVISLSSIPSVQ